MKLDKIDAICFQASQRVAQLVGGVIFVAAVDFGHEENLVAIPAL